MSVPRGQHRPGTQKAPEEHQCHQGMNEWTSGSPLLSPSFVLAQGSGIQEIPFQQRTEHGL